ncbi:aldo/keto reductase [Clostridium sp. YIM B02506]|uniref:aldo/keto reductase n=1 Tax=Clostridium sp. YIM B02506 TaxID=2910680 RepID=UPI001EEE76C9|nr:aldo/keto reductase [Clostridium sp. YIM B02506]
MEYEILNNGIKIPRIGFGVYQVSSNIAERCVIDALSSGYRHIDTARNYDNEREVGNAIKKCGITREEIFLTTKIYGAYSYREACGYIDEALNKLQTDYIDLLLFHWPSGNIVETYRAMEDYYKAGKLKAIGLSNFYGKDFKKIISNCEITPMVNQVEAHVFMQQKHFKEEMDKYNIRLEAWSPLACGKNNIFNNKILKIIADNHNKSVAQVALRFLYQKDILIIPKTVNIQRMKENLDILDFELSHNEVKEIEKLDTEKSLFGWY